MLAQMVSFSELFKMFSSNMFTEYNLSQVADLGKENLN